MGGKERAWGGEIQRGRELGKEFSGAEKKDWERDGGSVTDKGRRREREEENVEAIL